MYVPDVFREKTSSMKAMRNVEYDWMIGGAV